MWSSRSISANAAVSARAASLSEATANFNSSEVPSTFSNCDVRHTARAGDGWSALPTAISRKPARASVNFIRRLFIDDTVRSNQEPLAVKAKMQKIDCFFKPLLLYVQVARACHLESDGVAVLDDTREPRTTYLDGA